MSNHSELMSSSTTSQVHMRSCVSNVLCSSFFLLWHTFYGYLQQVEMFNESKNCSGFCVLTTDSNICNSFLSISSNNHLLNHSELQKTPWLVFFAHHHNISFRQLWRSTTAVVTVCLSKSNKYSFLHLLQNASRV